MVKTLPSNATGAGYISSQGLSSYMPCSQKTKEKQKGINIITNSIRYTNEKGVIKISLLKDGEMAVIKIKDNGMGIPKDDLPRIFERFYRVDKARTREMGGTGLGLSISKNMIEANGGYIFIDSEYGQWTEVTIKLPVNIEAFVQ